MTGTGRLDDKVTPRLSLRTPKPCPRCYAPMAKTVGGYVCGKHGFVAAKEPRR